MELLTDGAEGVSTPFSLTNNQFNYSNPFFVKMGIGDPTTEL